MLRQLTYSEVVNRRLHTDIFVEEAEPRCRMAFISNVSTHKILME